jgi:hypothetical protein
VGFIILAECSWEVARIRSTQRLEPTGHACAEATRGAGKAEFSGSPKGKAGDVRVQRRDRRMIWRNGVELVGSGSVPHCEMAMENERRYMV